MTRTGCGERLRCVCGETFTCSVWEHNSGQHWGAGDNGRGLHNAPRRLRC